MSCFCSSGKAKKKKSLYDELIIEERSIYVSELVSEKEREFLTMIFENLANRSSDRKLTQNNFMLFFSLTGLWGDKLFRYFNSGKKNGISLHEFLNGIGIFSNIQLKLQEAILMRRFRFSSILSKSRPTRVSGIGSF